MSKSGRPGFRIKVLVGAMYHDITPDRFDVWDELMFIKHVEDFTSPSRSATKPLTLPYHEIIVNYRER